MLSFRFWAAVTERHIELGILKTAFFKKLIQVPYFRSFG